ncbi:MAG TPA: ABC transporter transmembrane domain-containing protein, partial [Mycobacteriales bacterium]|nr:ABC transporter transmembrane domain-containing protein [Mycobacteriales bacterium]
MTSVGFDVTAGSPHYGAPRSSVDPDRAKSWLRRAMPIVLAHKRAFGTALALSFGGLLLQVQIPYLVQQAIDKAILGHRSTLGHYLWWIVVLAVLVGLVGYLSRLLLMRTAFDIEYDLRNIIYEHLSRLSFPFYDRAQSGQLISRANSDIRSVQMYLAFAPMIWVQCGVALVAFGYMLSINVPLAFVAMATMPFVFLVSQRMRRSMFPVSWLIQARLATVATIVDENINGVRVVKSFAAEQQQLAALERAADDVAWSYVKDADLRARWTPAVQNLPRVGLAFVLLLGGYLVVRGRLGIGAIVAFNSYLLMLQFPFQMLGMIIMMGQRAAASAARIYEILDEEPEIVDRPGAIELLECRGDVRFESVTFGYGSAPPVLRDFDLHLRAGETVALVGRTGVGKSSAARLIPRFYDVIAGAIRVDGHDVRYLTLGS